MIKPALAEFQALGRAAQVVPVTTELPGDLETPIGLYNKLCGNEAYGFLLESVEGGERWARYSYIGRRPLVRIQAFGDRVEIHRDGTVQERTGDVLTIVEEVMQPFTTVDFPHCPKFFGGAVGYFSYDLVKNFEVLPANNPDTLELPDVHLMIPQDLVVYDHVEQKIILVQYVLTHSGNVNGGLDGQTSAYEQALERLQALEREILAPGNRGVQQPHQIRELAIRSTETKDSFMEKVVKAKEYIRNGDIFQVVLSQRLEVDGPDDPFEAYRRLRSINPSPYLFFLDFGAYQLAGASPELLVKVENGRVATCPIAGTRPRGETTEEDVRLADELLNDEKELAEHRMLVDLGRNDLGKIASFGTVETKDLMHIQRFSHVMHIVTNVEGDLAPEFSMYDAIKACLPAGTVSGAPKIRAMEIIDELEGQKRGPYAGAVGYLGFNGNMDICITIRTIVFTEGKSYLQAGAGIVADSDPATEHEETLRKARALVEALRRA